METGLKQNLENGLRVCVDWLAFTFPDCEDVEEILYFLGLPRAEFQVMPRGLNGYQKQLRHSTSLIVLYEGNANMGVHVIVPGSAVHDLLVSYQETHMEVTPFGSDAMTVDDFDTTVLRDLLSYVTKTGNVTRLDLAVDDIGAQYYDIESVIYHLENGLYSSKFKGYRVLKQRVNGKDSCTVYLGSGKSSAMLRIYDKQAEQNAKRLKDGRPLIGESWLRWELELKHSNAHQSAIALSHGKTVSALTLGLLSNYIRFINVDDTNISRCSATDTWVSFLSGIEKFSVYVPTPARSIDDIKNWLKHQVAPSLAKVLIDDCGDMTYIYQMIKNGALRLSSHDLSVMKYLEGVI
jgi:hypothetical protein